MPARKPSNAPGGCLLESVEDLLDHLAWVLVVLGAPLDLDEAALLEHADRPTLLLTTQAWSGRSEISAASSASAAVASPRPQNSRPTQ